MSHALDQAWRSRVGRTVTLVDYERTGGIEKAVASSAERAYDRLTPSQQAAARQIFIRLTAVTSDGVDTATRATRAELVQGKDQAEAADVEAALAAFAAERLLILAADSVEMSHELLLTAWPLLRDSWLAEDRADRVVRARLHSEADDWARHARDDSYVLRGSRLEAALAATGRINAAPERWPPLTSTERDFLAASQRSARQFLAAARKKPADSGDEPLAPVFGVAGSPYRGHAFISYVREDSHKVDMLQNMLETAGIPVWRDTASLWPGENWRAKIRSAITHNALVFIACFSSYSAARQKSYQNEELLLAIDQLHLRRPDDPWLIPVRFDDCDVPDFELGAGRTLTSIQRADLFGANRDLEARRLMEAVQRLLRGPST